MPQYASLIDPADFGLIADYLKSPTSPIHFLVYVRSEAELVRLAESLDGDQFAQSIRPSYLPPSIAQGLTEGSILLSARPELRLEYATIEPETISRESTCQVLYYPPFYLVHAPGVFESVEKSKAINQRSRTMPATESQLDTDGAVRAETICYQPESFRAIGTFEGIETFTLAPPEPIELVRAEVGAVMEGNLVAAGIPWRDKHLMILETEDLRLAVPSEVRMRNDFSTPVRVRLKGVLAAEHGQDPHAAWEVYTRFALLQDVWLPASGQHLERRTQTADRWIREIESELLPGFYKALEQEESTVKHLMSMAATVNPITPRPLDPTSAMILSKVFRYGREFEAAYIVMHGGKLQADSAAYREAKEIWERYERWAQLPEEREHLRSATEGLLSQDRRIRSIILEHQSNIGVLKESLGETGALLQTLQGYGTTNVVMEQSTVMEQRARSLPEFIRAESLNQTVGRGRGIRN